MRSTHDGTFSTRTIRGPASAVAGVVAVLPVVVAPAAQSLVALVLAPLVATAVTLLVLTHLPRQPGPADTVTAARTALTAALAGHVATVLLLGGAPRTWWIAGLAAVAAVLDAVDGPVARRTGTASAAGARFDMQADAAFVAVLAVALTPVAGPWVLLAGGARYVFALAATFRAPLRNPLPPSQLRRVIAAVQAAVAVVAVVPVVPVGTVRGVLTVTVAAVLWSFLRDAVGAERRHRARLTLPATPDLLVATAHRTPVP